MRRYCKNVDITDIGFIERCIYLWIDRKKNRRDVQRFLAHYTDFNYRQIYEMTRIGVTDWLPDCIRKVAEDVQRRLKEEKLELPPIEFEDRYDDVCGKWRRIGIQKPIHQIFDYIAVEACKEMFMAKIGIYQMASIPGRGQESGMKQIFKWIQLDPKHCRYWVKGDVRKCYPSIPHDLIKSRFARDIKNKKVLWLVCILIDSFQEGLSIGSYFSQFACNYYLSQAYHYAEEWLCKERHRKDGSSVRIRLFYHQIWFMDDILFLGASARDIERAMERLAQYMNKFLGLTIKHGWHAYETDSISTDGKRHGRDIDMMGYRIYCDHITIRRRTFKRHRRKVLKARKKLGEKQGLTVAESRSLMSCNGKFKNSNSYKISKRLGIWQVARIASRIISAFDSQRQRLANEERRLWYEVNCSCNRGATGSPVYSAA